MARAWQSRVHSLMWRDAGVQSGTGVHSVMMVGAGSQHRVVRAMAKGERSKRMSGLVWSQEGFLEEVAFISTRS